MRSTRRRETLNSRRACQASKTSRARLFRLGLALSSILHGLRAETLLPNLPFRVGTPERDWLGGGGRDPVHLSPAPAPSRGELFFIDADIADPGAFWLAAPKGATVVCIPAAVDSWQFMAREAEQFRGLGAIHIISHGDPGVLVLNGRRYTAADFASRSAALRQIGRALSKNGDILLYGCNTGGGVDGAMLVTRLADFTGADVAASINLTGGSAGADWNLEIARGQIETIAAAPAGYDHALVTSSVSTVAQLKAAIATGNTDGVADTITLTSNITFAASADAITINVTDGQTMTIVGGGFTLSGNNLARVIDVTAGSVAISNLVISNGFVTGTGGNIGVNATGGAGGDSLGAGIRNAGTLTITGSTIAGHKAAGGGGGASQVGGGGGAGGGGGGFGTTFGGAGGANSPHSPGAASEGTGGNGAGYTLSPSQFLGGKGGTTTGGSGGTYGGYTNGGNGGTANNGSISIGGGGGGAGYDRGGGRGGHAAGGIYNTGTLTIIGSTITGNIGAGGGGGGGAATGSSDSGNGGAGGSGVGAIWNAGGVLQIDSGTNTSLGSANAGSGGAGGQATEGGSSNGAAGAATAQISTTGGGTTNTNYTPPAPTITSATYNANTGSLAVTGTNMTTGDAIAVDKLTLTGEGGSAYTLTTSNVTATSATAFSVTLNSTDLAAVNQILNKNGTSSTGGTNYNLGAADDWDANVTSGNTADTTNPITISNVPAPTITSATYDATTGVLVVTGTGFLKLSGAANDIDVSKLSVAGDATPYPLTTPSVEITSGIAFSVTLNGTDKAALTTRINNNGTSSLGAVAYNLAAAEDWAAGADAAVVVADLAGNGITASNVDSTPPAVLGVTSSTANGSYKVGDVISIQVNFTEAVTVTGTPQLILEAGATDRTINYASGSGTSTLSFTYTVQAGDASADLDYTGTTALALNGGTIKNAANNDATLTLASPGAANSLGANKAIVIDTTAPTVSGVTSSTANGTYQVGDVISIQINFAEAVTVTGTPQLTLETGATDRAVNYASGSGGTALTFNYTVQAGDVSLDLDYVAANSLGLNGGTIKDNANNDAVLTLPAPGAASSLGANKALVIDAGAPAVSGVTSSTANGSYNAGDVISIQVNFTKAVIVGGSPQLTLETGTTDRTISYLTGSGGPSLTFIYTVQSGDTSADLDYLAANALGLNGGTIQDVVGNNATLTLASPGAAGSLGANKALVIDTTAPSLISSVRQAPATVNVDAATATWRVTFDSAVSGIDTADFALTVLSGGPSGTIASVTPVSGSVYDVAVNALTGVGPLRLDLVAFGTGIADIAGNALPLGGFTSGDFYYVGAANVFDAISLATGTTRSVSGATTNKAAQRFTTAAAEPLVLTTLTAALGAVTGTPTPVVEIHADAAGTINPAVVATLTNPGSLLPNALNVWTGNVQLSAGTTYWVVFTDTSGAGAYAIQETAATAGGSGAWLTNPDYAYRHGANAGTGPQAGALKIALGAASRPVITSVLTASVIYKTAFTYQITATNTPTTFSATNLPPGLNQNTSTGLIFGAPLQAGTFNIALSALNSNGFGAPSTLVLTVDKAPLTVTADSFTRNYGTANPTLTVSYTGLLGDDTAGSLTTQPAATTSASVNSPPGRYTINITPGVSSNYTFTYVTGVLTVTPIAQEITFTGFANLIFGASTTLSATATSGLPVSFSLVSGPATLAGNTLTPTGLGTVTVRASQGGTATFDAAQVDRSFSVTAGPVTVTTPTQLPAPPAGGTAELSLVNINPNLSYQWQRNGSDLPGRTGPSLALDNVQPPTAGLYTYAATVPGGGTGISEPVIVGLSTTDKVIGTGEEVGANIVHPNGNVYDQVLLEGPGTSVTANPQQVTRVSFVDMTNDIVQVEFSGAGTLSLIMDNASSPAPASSYNQPGVNYVKGHAGLVITGADETSNLSIFSVGRSTAVNQGLFVDNLNYDGMADIAFVAIQSANGKFGGIRTGNVNYFAAQGFTGIYAPGVQLTGPMNVGDVNAFDSATPVLIFGSVAQNEARITGGDLFQANGQPVKVSGLVNLQFVIGTTSQGVTLPAQANRAVLLENGVNVTNQIVVQP